MDPNLFNYATSELSQDAFFAWLLAWADDQHSGEIHEFGKKFVQLIFERSAHKYPNSLNVTVQRQYKHMDVFCRINDTIALIFEDKAGTVEHSNQLSRYRSNIIEEGFAPDNIIEVYCQTYNQSEYPKGCVVLSRKNLLALFSEFWKVEEEVGSDVVRGFWRRLSDIESWHDAFRNLPVAQEWDGLQWSGFYIKLQEHIDGAWSYVANPSGGFMGFWWHFKPAENDRIEAYLQLEQDKLCFKICIDDENASDEERDFWKFRWNQLFCETGKDSGVVRPKVLRRGVYMTVAIFNGEYRVANQNGCIDIQATVKRLKSMENVLDATLAHALTK